MNVYDSDQAGVKSELSILPHPDQPITDQRSFSSVSLFPILDVVCPILFIQPAIYGTIPDEKYALRHTKCLNMQHLFCRIEDGFQ